MTIKPPINLLYANTAMRHATASPLARTRKVRSRVSRHTRKIGIFDISARAGLLFELLESVSRRQRTYTFYPVETAVPMGVGMIGESRIELLRRANPRQDLSDLHNNIMAEEFSDFLEHTRQKVEVDIIAGLFGPMLAFNDDGPNAGFCWNYFSMPVGDNVAISVFGLRQYARTAGRPFEAAVAILTFAQIWRSFYGVGFHKDSRGCLFDFCENRGDLVDVIRKAELCPESLAAIPPEERESVQKCLTTIRDYRR